MRSGCIGPSERALYIARILGHATLATAEKHYIHGQAARDFRELSRSIEGRRNEAPCHSGAD